MTIHAALSVAGRRRIGVTGLLLITLMIAIAALAPFGLAPPLEQDLENRFINASFDHPFGTDQFGRDQLSRKSMDYDRRRVLDRTGCQWPA